MATQNGAFTAGISAGAVFAGTVKQTGFPSHALNVKVELLLNTTWTDITHYVLVRDDTSITLGRTDESSSMQTSTLNLTLKNTDGRFTPDNASGAYYPYVQLNTQIRVSVSDFSVNHTGYTGYRFWGEVSEWPPQWDVTARDVYCKITASGIWRRLSQRSKTIGSPYTRFNNTLNASYNLVGYWPMEDGQGSQYFATTTSSTAANMTISGPPTNVPSLAATAVFPGSDALPSLNAAEFDGTVSTTLHPTTNQFRFVVLQPPGGDTGRGMSATPTAPAVIARMHTNGTVHTVDVGYGSPEGGGPLVITGLNSGGGQLFQSSSSLSTWGRPMMVLVSLAQVGGNITWAMNTITPGGTGWNTTATGTLNTATVDDVTSVIFNPGGTFSAACVGQAAVYYGNPPFSSTSQALNAWTGENALTRFNRLCTEEGLPYENIGSTTTTMGPQVDDTLVNILQEIEDTDGGLLYERRSAFGLGYRTMSSLQNQASAVTLDYNQQQVGQPLNPVNDDALVKNDITLTNYDGYSVRVYLANGARSLQNPPNGVGTGYEYARNVNSTNHTQINNLGIQLLNCGTVAKSRYPTITANLARTTTASLFTAIPSLRQGDYLTVSNMPAIGGAATQKQLVWGWTETINDFAWTLAFNTIPEDPWESSFNPGTSVTGQVPASPTTQSFSAGGTGTVTSAQIAEGAIVGANLAGGAVQGGNIATASITATNIADATITGTQIASATITGANIASATISGSNIVSGSITGSQIASATITGSNVASGTITGSNIGSATITASNISNATITTTQISGTAGITGSQLANNTVTATQIANATITTSQISATAGITGSQIANTTITAANITNATITATQVANGTITGAKIAGGTITASNIASATITNTQIASGTITGSNIAGGTITNSNIQNATITNISIANNTITTSQISNTAGITGTQIANSTITGSNIVGLTITAGLLAAGAVVAGKISAGAIDGMTITGASLVADGASGQFLIYSGTPAGGNLIGSWSGLSGSDGFGNPYPAGLSVQQGVITGLDIDSVNITNATLQGDVLSGSTVANPAITGGTMTETNLVFDQSGGRLLVYTSTTTTTTFSTAGDTTWTAPSGVTSAKVETWAAGAGGDGGSTTSGGSGGGAGEYACDPNYPVTPAVTYNLTVGAGGTGSNTGNGNGTDGGDTFFDGTGGVHAHGGNGDGTGGTGSTNPVHHDGGAGGTGSTSGGAGSGGNSGNATAAGNNGNNTSSSTGASSPSGQSGSGTGGAGGNNAANGSNGTAPGAGGGGAGMGTSTSSQAISYAPTWSASYKGPDATSGANSLRTTSAMYQGGETASGGAANGNQRCVFAFNRVQIASDFSGYTITACTIQLKNLHSWYSTGMTWELDEFQSLPGSAPSSMPTADYVSADASGTIAEGDTHIYSLSTSIAGRFVTGSSNGLGLGFNVYNDHPYNLNYYGYFDPLQTRFKIWGTISGAGNETAGNGADGQVKITYTSGQTLLASISPAAGTDPYSNSFNAGTWVYGTSGSAAGLVTSGSTAALQLTASSTPTAISNSALAFANSSGELMFVDGTDSQVYATGRKTLFTTSNSGTLTSLSTIFSTTVGARTYRVHGIIIVNGTSGAQVNTQLNVPATATGGLNLIVSRSTAFVGSVAGGLNGSVGVAVNLSTATGYICQIDGIFTTTGSGTVTFQVGSLTATGLVVASGSYIDFMPV